MKLAFLTAALAACGFAPQQASSIDARDPQIIDATLHDSPMADAHVVLPDGPKVFLDAPPPDPFDVSMCPTNYTAQLTSTASVSRYRVAAMGKAPVVEAACEADHPGWTHLIVPDVANEGYQMFHALDPATTFWVGAIQPPNQLHEDDGWLWFTGAAVPAGVWSAGQPNDNADNTENNDQNFAVIDNFNGTMNDSQNYTFYGICECDGAPVPANVAAYIAQ